MLPSLSKIYEACGVLVRKPCAHQLRHRFTLPVGASAGFSALRLYLPTSARMKWSKPAHWRHLDFGKQLLVGWLTARPFDRLARAKHGLIRQPFEICADARVCARLRKQSVRRMS